MTHPTTIRAQAAVAAAAAVALMGAAACGSGVEPNPSGPGQETSTTLGEPVTTLPETPDTTMPETPDTTMPETPDTTMPETPDTTMPGTPDTPAPTGADGHPEGWGLLFSDEFDGAELDRSKWCTRYVYGGGAALQEGYEDGECLRNGQGTLDTLSSNGEGQVYRDVNELGEELHVVRDGHLELNATHTAEEYQHQFGIEYESSMIRSKMEFAPTADDPLYFVARLRLPDAFGTWPAWWLNPGFGDDGAPGWPPEIDVLEAPLNYAGEGPDTFFVNSHGEGANGLSSSGSFSYVDETMFDPDNHHYLGDGSIRGQWLTLAFDWGVDEICWSIIPDGGEPADFACQEGYSWVDDDGGPANPASLLLNLAVGGWGADRDNGAIDPADYPGFASGEDVTSFDIDYVRVYQG